jgi:release factor glutamine methyltransferase
VTAFDVSKRAVFAARINGFVRRLPVRAQLGNLFDAVRNGPFDVVLANPPYVPCERKVVPTGRARAWDAGSDGRALLDPLCRRAPDLLSGQGFLLLVQSEVAGIDHSLRQLRAGGLKASAVARCQVPFGPVMRGRTEFLERSGLIEAGQQCEDLVVIRADRTQRTR